MRSCVNSSPLGDLCDFWLATLSLLYDFESRPLPDRFRIYTVAGVDQSCPEARWSVYFRLCTGDLGCYIVCEHTGSKRLQLDLVASPKNGSRCDCGFEGLLPASYRQEAGYS